MSVYKLSPHKRAYHFLNKHFPYLSKQVIQPIKI